MSNLKIKSAVKLLACLAGLAILVNILVACNSPTAAATATPEPFANLTPREVLDLYLTSYRAEEYAKCKKLLNPTMSDLVSSLDGFELKAKASRHEMGEITSYRITSETDLGAEWRYRVSVSYQGKDGEFTDNFFTVERRTNRWLITFITYF